MFGSSPLAVTSILILNILVFMAWNLASVETTDFMARNFLISWAGLLEGRFWTLITAAFSHNLFFHFFMNMFVLNGFGAAVERTIGFSSFLKFYLFAAAFSSLSHAVVSTFLLGEPNLPALGASGAISGLVFLFAVIYPRQQIFIFGLIPVPAKWAVAAFVGLDLWGLIAQTGGGGLPIGHGAHLGGVVAGILYYFFILRKNFSRA